MDTVNQALLFLHFLGLGLGFSVSFANIVMSGLISKAPPPEKAILGRFPPAMSRLGRIGLTLLWVSGAALMYTRWHDATFPWAFYAKLAAVVFLTVATTHIHSLERRVQKGETEAIVRIQATGKVATTLALIALWLAVVTFD